MKITIKIKKSAAKKLLESLSTTLKGHAITITVKDFESITGKQKSK